MTMGSKAHAAVRVIVAFRDADEARKFQQQYRGQIMNQTQVLAGDIVTNRSQEQAAGLK